MCASTVVEDVPADGAPALLIIENEFTNSAWKVHPLPLPFLGPSLPSLVGWDACAGRPDGVAVVGILAGCAVAFGFAHPVRPSRGASSGGPDRLGSTPARSR
jgi:hypothetical protein